MAKQKPQQKQKQKQKQSQTVIVNVKQEKPKQRRRKTTVKQSQTQPQPQPVIQQRYLAPDPTTARLISDLTSTIASIQKPTTPQVPQLAVPVQARITPPIQATPPATPQPINQQQRFQQTLRPASTPSLPQMSPVSFFSQPTTISPSPSFASTLSSKSSLMSMSTPSGSYREFSTPQSLYRPLLDNDFSIYSSSPEFFKPITPSPTLSSSPELLKPVAQRKTPEINFQLTKESSTQMTPVPPFSEKETQTKKKKKFKVEILEDEDVGPQTKSEIQEPVIYPNIEDVMKSLPKNNKGEIKKQGEAWKILTKEQKEQIKEIEQKNKPEEKIFSSDFFANKPKLDQPQEKPTDELYTVISGFPKQKPSDKFKLTIGDETTLALDEIKPVEESMFERAKKFFTKKTEPEKPEKPKKIKVPKDIQKELNFSDENIYPSKDEIQPITSEKPKKIKVPQEIASELAFNKTDLKEPEKPNDNFKEEPEKPRSLFSIVTGKI